MQSAVLVFHMPEWYYVMTQAVRPSVCQSKPAFGTYGHSFCMKTVAKLIVGLGLLWVYIALNRWCWHILPSVS